LTGFQQQKFLEPQKLLQPRELAPARTNTVQETVCNRYVFIQFDQQTLKCCLCKISLVEELFLSAQKLYRRLME
jgi:hypothetical protein